MNELDQIDAEDSERSASGCCYDTTHMMDHLTSCVWHALVLLSALLKHVLIFIKAQNNCFFCPRGAVVSE